MFRSRLPDSGHAAWPSSLRPAFERTAIASNRIEPPCRHFLFGCRAQEVMVLRSRILVVLLVFTCILSGVAVSVPFPVRYRAGLIHGFLRLSTLDGEAIAAGDLTQVARGDQVTTQLIFRFNFFLNDTATT